MLIAFSAFKILKKVFQFTVVLICILQTSLASAAVATIEAEGHYVVGDSENISTAKELARQEALRMAAERAGIYIESYSKTKNFKLVEDEIVSLASTILKVKRDNYVIDSMSGQGVKIICRVIAEVNSDDLERDSQTLYSRLKAIEERDKDIAKLKEENKRLREINNQANIIQENKNILTILEKSYEKALTADTTLENQKETAEKLRKLNPLNEILRIYDFRCDYLNLGSQAVIDKYEAYHQSHPQDLLSLLFVVNTKLSSMDKNDKPDSKTIKQIDEAVASIKSMFNNDRKLFYDYVEPSIMKDRMIISAPSPMSIYYLCDCIIGMKNGYDVNSITTFDKNGNVKNDVIMFIPRYDNTEETKKISKKISADFHNKWNKLLN